MKKPPIAPNFETDRLTVEKSLANKFALYLLTLYKPTITAYTGFHHIKKLKYN